MSHTVEVPGARIVTTEVGVEMVLPDTLDVVTTFVMLEQGRWFEDEVPFVRGWLQPGDVVVDVGANFGAYTLEAARVVGPTGRVVAFEPSSVTAAHLRASVERNGFDQVSVQQVALGGERGTAKLGLGSSPELAQLGAEGPSEEVRVDLLSDHDDALRGMGFLKLDAEGTEEAIVRASVDTLRREGPLVMFELRHGAQVNEGLLDAMTGALGFSLYQLCPGLDALVPFDLETMDDFRLNLFAAPAERAEALAAAGKLVTTAGAPRRASVSEVEAWAASRPLLRNAAASTEMLSLWRAAHDGSFPLADRYASMRAAFALGPTNDLADRLTFARVALELGERVAALDAVIPLFDEPIAAPTTAFACPIAAYEEDATFDASRMGRAQVIEVRLRYGAFSSFYEPDDVFELLEQYREAGGSSETIATRSALLHEKWGR